MSTVQGGERPSTAAYDEAWLDAITMSLPRLRWRRWRLSRKTGPIPRARRLAIENVILQRSMR